MASLLCLGTYWMLAGGGAEMLERHPGVYMVPQWPASKLRLFWIGIAVWNVAIGTMFFLGFPGAREAGRSGAVDRWGRLLFPVFFVGMWALVSFLLSAMGGWRALAQHYVATAQFSGKRFRFRSAQFGGYVNYGACLALGAGPMGLYLAVFPLFRLAHPSLLIPWPDVTAREANSWLVSAVELEFAKAPGVSMRLSRRLAQSLFDAAGIQQRVQPAA